MAKHKESFLNEALPSDMKTYLKCARQRLEGLATGLNLFSLTPLKAFVKGINDLSKRGQSDHGKEKSHAQTASKRTG
jgi:hypothetical protein